MRSLKATGFIAISISLLVFSNSCKKESVVQNNIVDTVYVGNTMPVTMAALTANKWMFHEGRGVRDGNLFYYLRGGTTNTENLDDEYLEFRSDFTGTRRDQAGVMLNYTWSFDDAEKSKITIYLTNTPATFEIKWYNVRMIGSKLYYDEYYTDGNAGFNAFSAIIRMPKP